ncbi:MAG TPA: ATP-binding protein [Micromonospora sp.]
MTDADPSTRRTVVPINASPLLSRTFDRGQITDLRHTVAACVAASGLAGQRLDDFVLAVNELITNAVRHGGGQGQVRLWREADALLCEVTDNGTGIGPDRLDHRERPAPNMAGGWGLWLAEQLSDEMLVRSGPAGTTVLISATVGPDRTTAGPA